MTYPLVTDRELAEAMLACEAARNTTERGTSGGRNRTDANGSLENGERALRRLQEHLVRWFGLDGVDALLLRALERTRPHYPVLSGVQRAAPGTLTLLGMEPTSSGDQFDDGPINDGVVELIAAILALIGRLVGDDMMRHVVRQIWPALHATSFPSESPNKNTRGQASE